jgi:hypothetical protein
MSRRTFSLIVVGRLVRVVLAAARPVERVLAGRVAGVAREGQDEEDGFNGGRWVYDRWWLQRQVPV